MARLFILFILCFASFNCSAYQNNTVDVKDYVNNTSSKVMVLVQSTASDDEKKSKLTTIFADTMDMDWIGKFVLGQHWRTLADNEKIDYLATYRKFLISTYVPLFKKYNHQVIIIKSVKQSNNGQFIVTSEIDSSDKKGSYKVEYRLRYVDGNFKVIDIIGEGISLLATQRADFSSIISNGGYKELKKQLEERSLATHTK